MKQMKRSVLNLPDLESPEPICSPIGVIAISAPRLKREMPKISVMEAQANTRVSCQVKFAIGVQFKINTISVTGKTDTVASFNFVNNALNILYCLLARRIACARNDFI